MLFVRNFLRSLVTHLEMSSECSYQDAIRKLNSLLSNKVTLKQVSEDIKAGKKCSNIEEMVDYLQRTGVTLNKLDELSVIHITGTKGKGSTSAMCESILRQHGYKTGFFSSPHLVSVCERIRLNGQVLEKGKFAQYLHQVFDYLDASKKSEDDMPRYFAFLTVMAYNIFLNEKVDVAIVEVGIGGAVDHTNVIRKVPVAGITSLGLDHTSILGNTIELIAEAKAGIIKENSKVYTVTQPQGAMDVLERVARNKESPLNIVPEFSKYNFPKDVKPFHSDVQVYYTNASLAIQLAHAWMNRNGCRKNDLVLNVPEETVRGLRECRWPGRYQVVDKNYAKFYLDGAHTQESIQICADWYQSISSSSNKILIFSSTGDRSSDVLLQPLKSISFSRVYFVIPKAYSKNSDTKDNYYDDERKKCQTNADVWRQLNEPKLDALSVETCVYDALIDIKKNWQGSSVLITGSLHLVGASLSILVPDLDNK